MLRGYHAPPEQEHLEQEWRVYPEMPLLNGLPHFFVQGAALPMHLMWVYREELVQFGHNVSDGVGSWVICDPGAPYLLMFAIANSPALHPNTVLAGEWVGLEGWDEDGSASWKVLPDFVVSADMSTSSPETPFSLYDIGLDVFLRLRLSRPVWFVSPYSDEVFHSGSKDSDDGPPGTRYCSLCNQCFSGNNFVYQHMRVMHPHLPKPQMRRFCFNEPPGPQRVLCCVREGPKRRVRPVADEEEGEAECAAERVAECSAKRVAR